MRLLDALLDDPVRFLDAPYDEAARLTRAETEAIQLKAARRRFAEMRRDVPAFRRFAEEQRVDQIRTLDDVVPLLFPHTVYKSYPLSYLEEGRFDRLTSWLNALTTRNLPPIERGMFQSIDRWIAHLDATTDLRLLHTFGTTGKLSMIPRSREEWRRGARILANSLRDFRGRGRGPNLYDKSRPVIQPFYRHGASAATRGVEMLTHGRAGDVHYLYPEHRFSADLASLAGRVRAAAARGETVSLTPQLLDLRETYARLEAEKPARMGRFFEEVLMRYGGRDVVLLGVWPIIADWAEEGLRRNLRGVFGKGSVLIVGGGTKGKTMADGWRERIFDFLGFESHIESYAMSELVANAPRCEAGNYHIPPVIAPFLLDPESGALLPREGRQTGRYAALDLLAESLWGGIVTGDRVTLAGWSEPCACGRAGVYAEPSIRRFSEIEGGDDKITCAGAPEAHDRAVTFLLGAA